MSSKEERFSIVSEAIIESRERNESGIPILVEGRKDREKLITLGFSGKIEVLNRGRPIDEVAVIMVEKYQVAVEVLMDWDRTGGRLQRRLMDAFASLDRPAIDELHSVLRKALKPETRCVESIPNELVEIIVEGQHRIP